MEEGEEKEAALKKFIKANDSFQLRLQAGMSSSIQGGGLGQLTNVAKARGFFSAVFGSSDSERKKILQEITKDVEGSTSDITNLLLELQKEIDIVENDDGGGKSGTRKSKVKLFDFDDDVAGRLGRLYQDIEAELEKRDSDADTVKRERFRRLTGLPTAEEQKDALSEFLGIQQERIDGENEEHENKLKRIEKERQEQLKGITDRKKAEEKLAQMLMSQVKKLASIQSQAFQGTITRLNSERDIILNNDNLTASEKDRLLKENDKKSRAVKIQQIKFERDMFQIEAAMEIAKLTMAANGAIFNIGASAAQSTVDATGSIGKFLQDLGPIVGPIAFGANDRRCFGTNFFCS